MGQNIFRFTLIHTSGSKVISEPDGWDKIKISLERDKEYYSLVELIETPFIFYGSNGVYDGGMDFLDQMKLNDQVNILIEISKNNGSSFESFFYGLIDIQSKQRIDARKLQFVITRSDLWTTFVNRRDIPVDINSTTDLNGNVVSNGNSMMLNLTSQKIRKKYSGTQRYNDSFYIDNTTEDYVVIDLENEILDEIDDKFHYQFTHSSEVPFELFTMLEDGTYTIECKYTLARRYTINDTSSLAGYGVYIQINAGIPIQFSRSDRFVDSGTLTLNNGTVLTALLGAPNSVSDFSYSGTFNLLKNDTIRIYYYNTGPGITAKPNYLLGNLGWSHENFSGIENYDYLGNFYDISNGPPFQGYWDASLNTYPNNGDASVKLGFSWLISTAGVLGGVPVLVGYALQALVDNPGTTPSNWWANEKHLYEGLEAYGDSYLRVSGDTTFNETQCEAFFIHDVAYEVIKRTVSDNSFYSEYTGSTHTLSLSYQSDGCGWNFSLIRGLQLRQYSLAEKPFSISFKQWWDGINPIMNLGLGYDVIDGNEVIRIEEKAFFFNDSPIIYFNWVNNILEGFDKESIYNKIKIGYKKWQSEDISGIDDPQTNHDYATLFKTAGQPITIQSEFIAASLPIEQARRTTRQKSADYKFDDDTFIIAINPNVDTSPIGYNPEIDENFDSVSGLLNSNSRYNLMLTPLRNLIRWFNVLSGCLQDYPTSVFKFNGGEGNYDMMSDYSGSATGICFNKIADTISEKQDLSMSYNGLLGHLFRPDVLEFKYPLSWENYKLIRDNRTRAIAVSETDANHTVCHIKKLEYDLINSLGTFTVWIK